MNNTLLGSNSQYIRLPLEDFLREQEESGIKEVDFLLKVPHVYVDSDKAWTDKALLDRYGIGIKAVTVPAYKYSITSSAGTIRREKTLSYYRRSLELAEELGAEYMCITGEGAPFDMEREVLLNNAKINLREIVRGSEVKILLGPCFGRENPDGAQASVLNYLEDIKEVLEEVPGLYAYMDISVSAVSGEGIADWFSALGDKIELVRFTDGNYSGYRVWGEGSLPGEKMFKELMDAGFNGPISLQIPGERYIENPIEVDRKNRMGVCSWQASRENN